MAWKGVHIPDPKEIFETIAIKIPIPIPFLAPYVAPTNNTPIVTGCMFGRGPKMTLPKDRTVTIATTPMNGLNFLDSDESPNIANRAPKTRPTSKIRIVSK